MAEILGPIRQLFEWVDTFPSSIALRESQYAYSWVTVAHVVGVCVFAGLLVTMDLRLVGLGHLELPFARLQRRLFNWQMVGMVVTFVTGVALVYAQPLRYYDSAFFWMKMATMGLAAINALTFHHGAYASVQDWDLAPRPPREARLAGILGIILWATVVVEGRLIPYSITWFPRE
jgi:uncharacterized membrane protein